VLHRLTAIFLQRNASSTRTATHNLSPDFIATYVTGQIVRVDGGDSLV
jgi:di/tripeptidase